MCWNPLWNRPSRNDMLTSVPIKMGKQSKCYKAPEWAQWLRACVISEEVTGSKPAGGRDAYLARCDKTRRVGDPWDRCPPIGISWDVVPGRLGPCLVTSFWYIWLAGCWIYSWLLPWLKKNIWFPPQVHLI